MNKITFAAILGLATFLCACHPEDKNKKIMEEFFKTYSQRKDLEALMGYYCQDVILTDAVAHLDIKGKDMIRHAYDWTDPNYRRHPEYWESIKVEKILSHDQTVVVKGYFTPYYYKDQLIERTDFCMWFRLDNQGKIKEEVDWLQYPFNVLEEIIALQQNTK